jgi:hypothetical protein
MSNELLLNITLQPQQNRRLGGIDAFHSIKRAFSVSGSFRKALNDLITDLHNSNKKLVQVTLSGKLLLEERFYLLGFVSAEVIGVEKNCWFALLTSKQIDSVNRNLSEFKRV